MKSSDNRKTKKKRSENKNVKTRFILERSERFERSEQLRYEYWC